MPEERRSLIGAIEGGGTKFVCAVGESPASMHTRTVIPTRDSDTTLQQCLQFFLETGGRQGGLAALGIGCFGPLQLQPQQVEFGCLLATPKAGWSGVSVMAPFREALAIPIALATDVGAAATGELHSGAGRGHRSLAYVTVGTGIGGAVAPGVVESRRMHEEMGHLPVRRDPRDAAFAGVCRFHGDCLEGLASGPAIRARWGCDLSSLPADHPGRSIIAGYLGQLAVAITLLHAPHRIVFGGGVMADGSLLPLVRQAALANLAGYLPHLRDAADMQQYLVAPGLGADSAIVGAAILASRLLGEFAVRRPHDHVP